MRTPTRRIRSGCCACAAIGHPAAAPPKSVMNSRRFMPFSIQDPDKKRTPAASAIRTNINFRERLCLPTALGCQLMEAETSVRRRFLGSSQASNGLDRAWTLYRFGPDAKCPVRVKLRSGDAFAPQADRLRAFRR